MTNTEQARESLDLVNRELSSTLETARSEIEGYVDGQAGREALRRAAGMLHLAGGALKLVELPSAALLAEEMEHTCQRLTEIEDEQEIERGVDALTRAMIQLPAYLERLLGGGRDVALVLLPLLNDLREFCRRPAMSEGTLLLLNAGPLVRASDAVAASPTVDIDEKFRAVAVRQRPVFQAGLVNLIRGSDVEAGLDQMIRASAELEKAAGAAEVDQLWRVVTAVLVALRDGGLEPSVTLKRLIGQADRQLKRLIDIGVTDSAASPPVELVNNLLYYVARARSDSPRVAEIRRRFRLDEFVPGDEHIERAREDLAGPSIRLMRTVAEAIKEDLEKVKDVLDIFVRTGMGDVQQLAPQLDMLKKISDTLGVLGLDSARARIQQKTERLGAIVSDGEVRDASVLEGVAATLLEVEDALDRELVDAVVPAADGEASGENEYRHVAQAVMSECIVNLAKVKDAVTRMVDNAADGHTIDQIQPQLTGIIAGLLMLNKARSGKVVDRIGATITARLTPGAPALKPEYLERLADAIVSVEYYMETVSLGRSDPWYMLDNAERCLDLLESLPQPAVPRPAPAPVTAPAAAAPPSVMEVDEDRSDPELVEIFIEEAKEEVANIRRFLPMWLDNPDNSEALISVRRSFHTLKGSGRMVGAQLLAEFAWSIENLLNRLINQTLAPIPQMLEFITQAIEAVPPLIEQLEIGIAPRVDVQLLMKQAEAYAEGDPDAEASTRDSMQVPALDSDDAVAAADAMDPVLTGIFVRETRGHLETLRAWISDAEVGSAPHAVTEPLYRACHTLLGSARMAACTTAIELAKPLEAEIARHYEQGVGLGDDSVDVLRAVAEEFETMVGRLAADESYHVDAALVARLAELGEPPPADDDVAQDSADVVAVAGFDPEIAAIFADEAAEILDQAEQSLDALRQGDSAGPVSELKRQLHTLKGGARLAGVMPMGDLSHALETLLGGDVAGGMPDATLDVIQRCLDQLHAMRDAVVAGRVLDVPDALSAALEQVAAGGDSGDEVVEPDAAPAFSATEAEPADAAPGPTTDEAPAVEPPPQPEPEAADASAATGAELAGDTRRDVRTLETADDAAAEAPTADVEPEDYATDELAADRAAAGVTADEASVGEAVAAEGAADVAVDEPAAGGAGLSAAAPVTPARPAETARVDAELLDVLLNGAGEISIFQSRLTQQLQSIEFHLGELGQTVTRLREQLRNLEAETEAEILHKHQDEAEYGEGFDPLELDRYSTIQQLSRALAETANDVASLNELLYGLTTETDTLLTQQARVTAELQDGLMQTRMVSFQRHVARLARIVRQASAETGRLAELEVEGAHSELDRHVLDSVLPALEHLLRNAVVHGIEKPEVRRAADKAETGRVTLKLRRDGAEVLVEVADDGAGLDLDAIRRKAIEQGFIDSSHPLSEQEAGELILRPGFSTAGELTQAAGRGVGMDVVDNDVKKLGGSMRIETTRGHGSRFIIRLPYTLAITHALVVNVGEETFALPLPTVEGIFRIRREQLLETLTQDDPRLEYGDVSYRVQHLGSLVGSSPSALPDEETAVSLVLVRAGEQSTALLTDSIEGSREIVVKTLGPHLLSVPGISGATIIGDGRIIVILDPVTLVRRYEGGDRPAQVEKPLERELCALVVDDSITMRRVTQRLLERRGVRVLTARDGLDAISVLQESEADIILLDIEMPRMDGYQFATHVRNDARLKDTPIIMITSRSGEKHRAKAIEIGVNDYLSKPYQEGQLIGAMENLLGRSL